MSQFVARSSAPPTPPGSGGAFGADAPAPSGGEDGGAAPSAARNEAGAQPIPREIARTPARRLTPRPLPMSALLMSPSRTECMRFLQWLVDDLAGAPEFIIGRLRGESRMVEGRRVSPPSTF